jgi:DNA-binding XRE family transcriptional regulator
MHGSSEQDAIMAVLPKPRGAPVTAREIFTRLGISSPTRVQRASLSQSLARLAKTGLATRVEPPRRLSGNGYLWRRAKFTVEKHVSADQVLKARKLLDWDQNDLATRACVSQPTISRLERGFRLSDKFAAAVRHAFEAAGVEFKRRKENVTLRRL